MKYRYLSIFLLILVLSLGAVSAQDITASDDGIALVQDNEILSASEYIIDDSNYGSYFDNETGAILENSNISDGDTIKLGNVSDKEFVIDKLLTITSNSSSDVLTNVSFYFNSGSDNSTISNLNFISYDAQTSTISIDNASNIAISENIIDIEGAENAGDIFAIFAVYADNLNVQANVISYTGKTNGTAFNFALYVLGSEDIEVKENVVEIEIPAGDLDWATGFGTSEGIVFAACDNLAFTDNNITLITNESVGLYPSVYVVHAAYSDNVAVEGNKIEALSEIDYLYGVKVDGENFIVSDNVINVGSTANYACGVEIGNPSSGVVDGNNISVIAPVSAYAVYAADWYGAGCSVNISNNIIEGIANTFFGVSLFGVNEAVVEGNSIEAIGNYTTGVASNAKVLIVNDNVFDLEGSSVGDPLGYDSLGVDNVAINAKGGKVAISYNDITSTGKGLVVIGSNLTAERNTINVNDTGLADSYAVYLANDTDVLFMNNVIYFTGKTNGTTVNNAMYAENSTVDSISENYFGIHIPSVDVSWKEIPATSGNWVSFPVSEGIVFRDMTDLEFVDNYIDLTATDVVTEYGYDTIYVVDVKSDMAAIDGNTIIANGNAYIYGIISTGRAFITNNEIILNSQKNYACGIDIEFESSGAVDGNVIDLTAPYVAYGIYASMDMENWVYSGEMEYTNNDIIINSYAGYAMSLYGSEALIDGNKIYMEGNYTMGILAMMMDDIATITNNEINVQGIENGTKNVGDMVPAQTVGILAMSESQIHYNSITSTGEYTIINSGLSYDSEITDNYLVSAELLGDDSVNDRSDEALVENNIPIADATNYNLTNDTFFLFFNENGFIRENITSESLTFIGEFSNLPPWIIIDRPVKLLSDDAVLGDMSFNIQSDNVTVDGFTFVSEELSEIIRIEDVVNISIINNNFVVDGLPYDTNHVISVIMSDDVLIDNNNITFGVETDDTLQNIAIHARGSDNLVITRNTVAALLPARSINWTTNTVYSEGVSLFDCDNAVLENNTIDVNTIDKMSTYDTVYAVNIRGNDVTFTDNIISISGAPYGYGLVIAGEYFEIDDNIIIADNDDYSCGIDVESNSNGIIAGNMIAVNGTSAYGIYTANWAGDVKAEIADNVILAEGNTVFGMSLSGSEAIVGDNLIELNGNYTTGIASAVANITIEENTINATGSNEGTPAGYDSMGIETTGVHIVRGNANVTNNNITTTGEFAVDAKGTGSVTDNYLIASAYTGDAAVDLNVGDTLVANNTPAMQRVIIQAEDVVMYYKNGTRYTLKVTDMNGNPLDNENVTLTINGATYARTTDENGTASIAINLSPGNFSASVSYIGTGNCTNSTIENTITVLSTIYGEDLVKMYRNASQYYATFLDGQGNPLANGTDVTFNINGVMYTRQTNENGTARLNINLGPGTYILTAINPVNNQMYSNNITVISNIANNTDLVKYYKNDSQYVVTVIGADGKVVGAGENVTFNINGVMYTRQTNESGQAKLNINLGPGNYTITAIYGECMASNNIEVLPILYAKDLVKKYGTSDQFRALLLDGQGNPFPGQNITFNINGVFYQRTTDADGYAALTIRLGAAVDEYIITSSYNGTSISNKIIIQP